MKSKSVILSGLCIQCIFLIFWLFNAPEVHGQLKVAREELQEGNAKLPVLTIRNGNAETSIAYDPSKSASENLLARTKVRLSLANDEYKSIARAPLLAGVINVFILAILLKWSKR